MKGMPSGNYAASTANKTTRGPRQHYWLKKRKAGPEAIVGRAEDPKKAHNSQMDNLMALRKNGLLTRGYPLVDCVSNITHQVVGHKSSCQNQMADLGWMPEETSSAAETTMLRRLLTRFHRPVRTSRQQPVKTS